MDGIDQRHKLIVQSFTEAVDAIRPRYADIEVQVLVQELALSCSSFVNIFLSPFFSGVLSSLALPLVSYFSL